MDRLPSPIGVEKIRRKRRSSIANRARILPSAFAVAVALASRCHSERRICAKNLSRFCKQRAGDLVRRFLAGWGDVYRPRGLKNYFQLRVFQYFKLHLYQNKKRVVLLMFRSGNYAREGMFDRGCRKFFPKYLKPRT
jgi:hypothetical protein